MLNIAICDDDPLFRSILKPMIAQAAANAGQSVEIAEFSAGDSLMHELRQGRRHIDILFLDVMLGGSVSGLEFGQMIRERDPFIQMIFISSDSEYSLDVFDLEAVYFLNKPVTPERLARAFDLALRRISAQKLSYLRINSRGHHINVPYADILYLESERRVIIIHRTASEHQYYARLDYLEQIVPDSFIRVHQSYLVNMDYVASLTHGHCELINGEVIPIAQKRRSFVRRRYLQYIREKTASQPAPG